MNISLKTSVIVAAIGLLLAAPSTQADPISNYQCLQEYRACIAAGYDQDMCIDNYYYCRYGYYPIKASGAMMAAPARKD